MESLSLIIAVYNSDGVTVCSEDRAGIYDPAGAFIPTESGIIKSKRVTADIIGAAAGRISLASYMMDFVMSLAQTFSFDKIANIIPIVAETLWQASGDNPQLSVLLTGWDSERNRIRVIQWHHLQKNHDCFGEPEASTNPGYLLQGATPDVLEIARQLMAGGNVPSRFEEIYAKLADASPMIGRSLTVHTVTRPDGRKTSRQHGSQARSAKLRTGRLHGFSKSCLYPAQRTGFHCARAINHDQFHIQRYVDKPKLVGAVGAACGQLNIERIFRNAKLYESHGQHQVLHLQLRQRFDRRDWFY